MAIDRDQYINTLLKETVQLPENEAKLRDLLVANDKAITAAETQIANLKVQIAQLEKTVIHLCGRGSVYADQLFEAAQLRATAIDQKMVELTASPASAPEAQVPLNGTPVTAQV